MSAKPQDNPLVTNDLTGSEKSLAYIRIIRVLDDVCMYLFVFFLDLKPMRSHPWDSVLSRPIS